MKKSSTRKRFNGLRTLAIFALVSTIALFSFLMIESSMDVSKSGALTQAFYDMFRPVYDTIKDEPDVIIPRSLSFSRKVPPTGSSATFNGDVIPLKVVFKPAGAVESPYHFEYFNSKKEPIGSENLPFTIDEDNVLTIHDYFSSGYLVKAVLDSNPDVQSNFVSVYSYGISRPTKDTVFELSLIDYKGNPIGTAENPLIVGKKVTVTVNNKDYSASLFDYTSSNEDAVKCINGVVYAVGEGSATITATLELDGLFWEYTFDVVTLSPAPTPPDPDDPNPEVPDDDIIPEAILGDDVVYITLGENFLFSDYNLEYFPADAKDGYVVEYEQYDFANITASAIYPKGEGTGTITFVSVYDESVTKTVTFVISAPPVEHIDILTDSVISIYGTTRLRAHTDPTYADNDVIWSVVDGKATIDENGKVQPEGLGTITIRATSVSNPEIFTEKTFTVKIASDFAGFVRKIMGHFSLYMLLGIGLGTTFYLFLRKKWLTPIFAGVLGCFSAVLSETLQKFADGRFSNPVDMMVDSVGALFGIGIAIAVMTLVSIIWRATSPKTHRSFKIALTTINFTTMFRSRETLDMLYSPDVYVRETAPTEKDNITESDEPNKKDVQNECDIPTGTDCPIQQGEQSLPDLDAITTDKE